jgi:hypothetical protein
MTNNYGKVLNGGRCIALQNESICLNLNLDNNKLRGEEEIS